MICDLACNCSRRTYLQWWRRVPLAMRKDFTGPGLRGLARGSIDVHLEMPRLTSGLHLHTKARLTKDLLTDRLIGSLLHLQPPCNTVLRRIGENFEPTSEAATILLKRINQSSNQSINRLCIAVMPSRTFPVLFLPRTWKFS